MHDTTGVLVLVVVVAAGVGSTTPVAGAAEEETGKGLSVPVVVINRVGVQTPDPPNSTSASQQHPLSVRGTPSASDAHSSSASASDSRLPSASAPATSSLFRNAFGRMTSYATRSRPASAPDRMMSQDSSSRPDISSDPPSVYDTLTRHICRTLHVFPNFGLISYIHYFVY